jgi:two-component system, NarL family, response regulator DevR
LLGFFLVDDHEVVRRGLIELLRADPELDCVGEAGSVAEAMSKIPAVGPDVAVLDDWLPDGNGIELCRDLLSFMPDLRCLMLTSSTSDEAMLYAILAGGSGYAVWAWPGGPIALGANGCEARDQPCPMRSSSARLGSLTRGRP